MFQKYRRYLTLSFKVLQVILSTYSLYYEI
jgi:hypothetical protein